MNIIESAVVIIKNSLLFDNELKNGQHCKLRKINDDIKSKLQTLMLLSGYDKDDTEILALCKRLYELNDSTIKIAEGSQIQSNNNILLFFYKEGCSPSASFVDEWKKLKVNVGSRAKLFSINCSKEKYVDVCNKFGIYQYPTVKYVSNDKTYDYFGEMTALGIQREFF